MLSREKAQKWLFISIFLITTAFMLSGCGLFGPEEENTAQPMDPPPSEQTGTENPAIEVTQDGELAESAEKSEEASATYKAELYLLDPSRHVVPVTMDLPKVEGRAQQVLKYMVKSGPVEQMLPEGFSAVLPEGTEIQGMTIKDGVATVDFSPEFAKYQAAEEQGIVDAITWALTQFNNVKAVKIWINGYPQEVMPVSGTPVSILSRDNGINMELASNIDIGHTSKVTLYFLGETEDLTYFVPVTRVIPKVENIATATLNELIKGPQQGSQLFDTLLPTTKVLNTEVVQGTAVANFNQSLLGYEPGKASPDAIQSIVLSLTENTVASQVQIKVNGETNVMAGDLDLSKPVDRPSSLNAYRF